MNSLKQRIFVGLLFAVPVSLATFLFGQAPYVQAGMAEQKAPNCAACHTDFQEAWMLGTHGQATDDPAFKEAWAAQGNPGACLVCHVTGYDPNTATWTADGVSCEACHSPINANHPREPIPVDRSANSCGRCHTDARFGWQDWEGSAHYRRDMTCIVCHDPHTTQLKLMPKGQSAFEDASALCITCHSDHSMNFPYSKHSQAGATCVSCHMEHLSAVDRPNHTIHDHSFKASLSSCIGCHAGQMHAASPGTQISNVPAGKASNVSKSGISSEPAPVSPLGFAGLAGLIGLAGGMVLSPWLEKVCRRLSGGSRDEND